MIPVREEQVGEQVWVRRRTFGITYQSGVVDWLSCIEETVKWLPLTEVTIKVGTSQMQSSVAVCSKINYLSVS